MTEIPYTPLVGKIQKYFKKIQETGVPPRKVDISWLRQCAFKSGNDNYLLKILEFIGFVDSSRSPTELWQKYKSPIDSKAVLAQGIRQGYSELFELYPDANQKSRDILYAYFSSKTGKAKRTVDLMVMTFLNLCQIADFETEAPPAISETAAKTTMRPAMLPAAGPVLEKPAIPQIHINIQLHLPPSTDPTVFDNLFKSMKKHLLSAE